MANGENILEKIAARTRLRVEEERAVVGIEQVAEAAFARLERERVAGAVANGVPAPGGLAPGAPAAGGLTAFERNLRAPGMSFICEVKKASPSKGLIAPDFDYRGIARAYEQAGAAAISCLTEPFWFQGSDAYLEQIAAERAVPVLRKDFVVDEYMVYQAKALGAGAVLLICAILGDAELARYGALADELGMAALFEAHDASEVDRALRAGARVVGVNNRDLRTFEVDLQTSLHLRALVPPEVAFVSESGVMTRADVARLEDAGVDAVLVGETLMRAPDKRAALEELAGRPLVPVAGGRP